MGRWCVCLPCGFQLQRSCFFLFCFCFHLSLHHHLIFSVSFLCLIFPIAFPLCCRKNPLSLVSTSGRVMLLLNQTLVFCFVCVCLCLCSIDGQRFWWCTAGLLQRRWKWCSTTKARLHSDRNRCTAQWYSARNTHSSTGWCRRCAVKTRRYTRPTAVTGKRYRCSQRSRSSRYRYHYSHRATCQSARHTGITVTGRQSRQ